MPRASPLGHGKEGRRVRRLSCGRSTLGCNEILREGLVESAVAQYWSRNRKAVVQAVQKGRDVLATAFFHAYLGHGYNLPPLSTAYHYEPAFRELSAGDGQHVLGLEAPLWTESVPNRARLDYQTYQRLTAPVETGWIPSEKQDLRESRTRLAVFLLRLDELGVRYARAKDADPPSV